MRFTIALLALIGASAYAAPPEEIDEATGRKIKYLERTEIEFQGVGLNGELVGPEGILVGEQRRPVFNPLIKLRENWKSEMAESVDQVK
jgi:hypothetical protein